MREWVRVVQYLHGSGMPRGARRIHNQRESGYERSSICKATACHGPPAEFEGWAC